MVIIISLSSLDVARRPANVVLKSILTVAGKTTFLCGVETGLAGRVAWNAVIVFIIEISIVLIARNNTLAGSQDMEVVTSHALVVGRARTGETALVAGQTATIVEVVTGLAGCTVIGIGASASVAFGLARGTDDVGVFVRELEN